MDEELDSWRLAAAVMVFISILVLFVQRMVGELFNPAFEVCIFYIPTVVAFAVYLVLRLKWRHH